VLSVDVEEYYHALVFQEQTRGESRAWPSRVEYSTGRVLELLARHDVKATFFTLGEVADAQPALVRKIAGEGHEVACHGQRHVRVDGLSPAEFRRDVRRAKAVLEDVTGQLVRGYRAPNFSIGPRERWAHSILLEEGFAYDSSSYPIRHDRYGDPSAPRSPHPVAGRGGRTLIEFPIGTVRVAGWNLPIGGGGYFRLLPVRWFSWGIAAVNQREGRPVMFYVHPWELDPDQPRARMSRLAGWRHYVGLGRTARKLECLLERFRFTTASEALGLGAA
jgi:polysaccharide deacetylase family protein (PEP-CTERM system associated)